MLKLSIVSPCYNEEEVLATSAERLDTLLDELIAKGKIAADSYVLFVNDGSRDRTWDIIRGLSDRSDRFHGLCLAHNVGHQHAIMAGMMEARHDADGVVTIDADLQDDLRCIEQMVDAYTEGYDIVYGVKKSRTSDPALKRMTAVAFYKLQQKMGVESVFNHADFRFLSRRVLDALSEYGERNLYLRGLIPQIGFDATTVDDTISERQAGKSKYTLAKMLNLAIDGITSFTVRPIYLILYMGVIFLFISLLIGLYVLISLIIGSAEHGWSSLILSVWLVGGVVVLSIGGIGLYIGKIYTEVKHRPLYHVKEKC